VYFDNLKVKHHRGPLLEESHYYPFGLTMAGISSKAAGKLENRHKFNDGTELTNDFDLSLYETPFRGYDPQLGRFWQIDPYADEFDSWTPYNFAENNPIAFNDPTGLSKQGYGFEEDAQADESLPEVVVRPTTKKMNATQMNAFYARSLRYDESSGSYKPHISSNYDAATQNFLSSYHRMKQREHEFDQGVSTVVQEGILFAVPWGRVVKGFSWAYRAAKTRQAAKVLKLGGFGDDAAVIANSANLIPKKGWYDVVVHGTEDGLNFVINQKIVTPAQLYDKMLTAGYSQGTRIRLLSCFSGSVPGGAASQLATLTNSMVVAPRSWVTVSDGLGFIQKGKFLTGEGVSKFSVFK
jgi:RHS repeat-associated protein